MARICDSSAASIHPSNPTASNRSSTRSIVNRPSHETITMSDLRLKQAVQTILASFLEQRQSIHDDIAQDIYRTIRDEASLLLERETICDVFSSDPFGLVKPDDDDTDDDVKKKEKNSDMIARVKASTVLCLSSRLNLA
jgi:hypothetical protein